MKKQDSSCILIVEDDGSIVLRLRQSMQKWGYECESACSMEEALEKVRGKTFSLALMDIFLGDDKSAGIDTALQLKEKYNLPSIFMTAYADDASLERAKTAEPYGYLVKPIQETALHAMLEMALNRIRMDRKLKQSKERLRMALDAANAGIWWIDLLSGEAGIDERLKNVTGYSKDDIPPKLDGNFHHPDDFPIITRKIGEILSGKSEIFESENRIRHKDGRWIWVRSSAKVSRRDENGKALSLVGTAIDITLRKESEKKQKDLEAMLHKSRKLESIGQLAGGIAHDFNNLIYIIMGYCGILIDEISGEDHLSDNVKEIMKAAERAGILVRQLLLFSRRESMKKQVVDLNVLVGHFEEKLRISVGEKVGLEFHFETEPAVVDVDPGQMEQVIVNLCENAKDALPETGGKIVIEIQNLEVGPEFCDKYPWSSPGNYVCLTISDTGAGMSREVREKVFEPFYTTKEVGKGSGLGLAAAYGIVKSHRGMIHVYSEPGHGSSFRIYLPLSRPKGPSSNEIARKAPTPGGREIILLAEDEEGVVKFTVRILEKYGYKVLIARDGREAIDLVNQHTEKIDLALLDVIMPGAGGREVWREIQRVRPELPVVFLTGYGKGILPQDMAPEKSYEILQKPVVTSELLQAIRRNLDKSKP